jgi:hypothetical protein
LKHRPQDPKRKRRKRRNLAKDDGDHMSKDAESQPHREPLSTGHKAMSPTVALPPSKEKQTRDLELR